MIVSGTDFRVYNCGVQLTIIEFRVVFWWGPRATGVLQPAVGHGSQGAWKKEKCRHA
jgi:hypothetical protein